MTSRLDHVSIDCHDAFALSTWWKAVLGYTDVDGDPNLPGHEECALVDPAGGQTLLFIEVPDSKAVKNRVHFDLSPTDLRRDAEIERVITLGATPPADLRKPDGTGWMVLADPEGRVLHRPQRCRTLRAGVTRHGGAGRRSGRSIRRRRVPMYEPCRP